MHARYAEMSNYADAIQDNIVSCLRATNGRPYHFIRSKLPDNQHYDCRANADKICRFLPLRKNKDVWVDNCEIFCLIFIKNTLKLRSEIF